MTISDSPAQPTGEIPRKNRLHQKSSKFQWKICKQFGRIPTRVKGWKPPKMTKKTSDEHVSAFCGTHRSHVIEARIDILRKRFLYVVSKYEWPKSGAYREKRLNVFFQAEIWKFRNSRISIDISAIRRSMKTIFKSVGSEELGNRRPASNFSRKRQNVLLRNQRCGAYFN